MSTRFLRMMWSMNGWHRFCETPSPSRVDIHVHRPNLQLSLKESMNTHPTTNRTVLMKQILLSLVLFSFTFNCNSDQQPKINNEAEITSAKAAIKEFAGALQAELKAAMQASGPVAAIAVCNTRAMPITSQVASKHGMQLSRVSLKNRNPANAPNQWQAAVLEDFERRKAAGEALGSLAWSETAAIDGRKEFRFMKAIPTGEICLRCHGTELAPDVSQILAALYPEDRATGYREGDIRGAFVVTRKLPN